ncbi:MAG: YigZ family protein [Methanobrevibacter sp.]|jgi:uncharacterized YigZ family protein|nr:YigZ family protein [Methanobrevibacter sp.]
MKSISKEIETKIEIKKSIFISRIYPITSKQKSIEIIKNISEKYKDATHHCTAFIIKGIESSDDDGEPNGTAGKPMLNVLKQNNLENILAIVTRYFGGIKLGSGGLVRAYSKSVQQAIAISNIIELNPHQIYEISFNYSNLKFIENEIRKNNFRILNKEFQEDIQYKIALNNKNIETLKDFKNKLKDSSTIKFIEEKHL